MESKFNLLRGIVMGSFLENDDKKEVIEFVNELEEMSSKKIKPIATIKFDKEDMQEIIDKTIKDMEINIELDIQKIRNSAIDDFAEKIMEYCSMSDMNKKMIKLIAEKLKERGVEK